MTEEYLCGLFAKTGAVVVGFKIIKDKTTGIPLNYGFVEFESHEMAAKILQLLNNSINPATNKPFRLNWGVHNSRADQQMPKIENYQFENTKNQQFESPKNQNKFKHSFMTQVSVFLLLYYNSLSLTKLIIDIRW